MAAPFVTAGDVRAYLAAKIDSLRADAQRLASISARANATRLREEEAAVRLLLAELDAVGFANQAVK